MKVIFDTRGWARAIAELPAPGPLPCKTVLVPGARLVQTLRREMASLDPGQTGLGTLFCTLGSAASSVLEAAAVEFLPGEERLRPARLRELFDSLLPLSYFRRDLLADAPGWDETFAGAISDLEGAALRPAELPDDRGRLSDLALLWQAADAVAGRSWSRQRRILEAACLLEANPESWPFAGPVLVALRGTETAAEVRLARAIPNAELALFAARPLRRAHLDRIEALLGADARQALAGFDVPTQTSPGSELQLLRANLFEDPARLVDPARPRSEGPDGSVHLEEHAGLESELEAAAEWVAQEIAEHQTPLGEIALLVPGLDPLAGLLVTRLARLATPVPTFVAGGLPLCDQAAGVRLLALLRALSGYLSAGAVAEVLPFLRLAERSRLRRDEAIAVAYSLGTVGGSPSRPADALEWTTRLEARVARDTARLAALRVDDSAHDLRERRALEDALPMFEAVLAPLSGLARVMGAVLEHAALSASWPALRDFCAAHLLAPGDGPPPWTLLDAALSPAIGDPACGEANGSAALGLIEETLLGLRVTSGRFGDPAVYIGTIGGAAGIPFSSVRILGLTEGKLPRAPREDAVLPDALRARISPALPRGEHRVLSELFAFDRVVRDARSRIVLSTPRLGVERSMREPSSIFIEVSAALGRPNRETGACDRVVPDRSALERDYFVPARELLAGQRTRRPLSPTAWLDRVAAGIRELPTAWLVSPDTDLDRIREIQMANGWSQLDGFLDCPEPGRVLPGLSPEWPISASRLATLLACPHRFLLESVLGFGAPAAPPSLRGLDALTYGSLFHEVAERFYSLHGRDFGERLAPPTSRSTRRLSPGAHDQSKLCPWQEIISQLAAEAMAGLCERVPLAGEAVRQRELERLERDLRALLAYDWDSRRKRTFAAVERPFGFDAPVKIGRGKSALYVRGFIDRLDREHGTTLVRDLKTGRPHPRYGAEQVASPKLDLQIALYSLVTRELAKKWQLPAKVEAAYVYPDRRGQNERAFRSDIDELLRLGRSWLGLAARLLRAGWLPPLPHGGDCGFCPFPVLCADPARCQEVDSSTALPACAADHGGDQALLDELMALQEGEA